MKLFISYILLGVLACAGGIGAAYLYHTSETSSTEETFYNQQWVISDASTLEAAASFSSKSWDAGKIDPQKTYTFDFIVTNVGSAPLTISLDSTLEGPVQTDLTETVTIEIKKSYPVTVRIDASKVDKNIDQKIQLKTNIPDSPLVELTVTAQAAAE